MQKILVLIATLSLLAGCGGGSSGSSFTSSSSSSSGGSSSSSSSSGSGGSSSSSSSSSGGSTSTNNNVAAVYVDQGPAAYTAANYASVDTLFVTVTVCVPGFTDSTHCQTIDHVQVDTGSTGLRIIQSQVLTLPVGTTGGLQYAQASGGGVLAECMQYVDGSAWGPIVTADLYVGGAGSAGNGEKAAGIPMQVIGTGAYPMPTSGCPGPAENTVVTFGANGIIGVGSFQQDCGVCCTPEYSAVGCVNSSDQVSNAGFYYSCSSPSSCAVTTATLAQQVSNPISSFATDNNGAVISLPAVGSAGAATVNGTLTFGINTETNNTAPNTLTTLWLDPYYGEFSTTFIGQTLSSSYIDSGSNALYFPDSNIPTCGSNTVAPGFYCPASTELQSATLVSYSGSGAGAGGTTGTTVNFSVASATTLFNTSTINAAFNNLAAPASAGSTTTTSSSTTNTFDWGLPFFFGLNVYTSIQPSPPTETSPPTASPYIAFQANSGVLN